MQGVNLKTSLVIGVAAAAFAAYPAFAQNSATSPAPVPAAATSNPSGGIQKATTATMAVRFLSIRSVDLMATKLVGTNVYNNQNWSLREIQDLVLDNGK